MKKISKRYIIIIFIIVVNIVFITIPYNIKKNNIIKEIDGLQKHSHIATQKEDRDFYDIYDRFDVMIKELGLKFISKQVQIDKKSIKITISMKSDSKAWGNLMISTSKKIPQLSVLSADINMKEGSDTQIVFYSGLK